MKRILPIALAVITLLIAAFYALNAYIYAEKQAPVTADHKNIAYTIEGQSVTLSGGVAEIPAAPESAAKVTVRYFGNDYRTDLNGDGREDIAFLVSREAGGSGTAYYVVAAVATEEGYVGSDGYFLGDRIAPQTIDASPNPRHRNVIVANYMDRAPGEPMTAQPSLGKSAYLKLDPERLEWGVVEPDFEGESR